MRITSLTIKNFQAVDSVRLEHFGDLNILIGPKHSGKTSILESLYFQFHHGGLADAKAYAGFLNRTYGTQEQYFSITTEIQDDAASHAVATIVQPEGAADTVQRTGGVVTGSEATQYMQDCGNRIKYIPTWRNDKDVYYGGPEPAAQQRKRLQQALLELAKEKQAWERFLDTLDDFFPQLILGPQPVRDILDFFGTGFLSTVKMLLYLHDPRVTVLLIDEPEIYFYPSLARKFIRLVGTLLAEGVQKQVFVATHSPMFLSQKEITHFYHIQRDREGHTHAALRGRDELLRSLEYSGTQPESILTAEMMLYVEGPWDIAVFEEFIKKFPELDRVHISIQQLGGGAVGNMNMDPLRLKQNNLFSFVVLDSEKTGKRDRGDVSHYAFRDRCFHAHVYCLILERRAIENYFTPRALRSAFGKRVPENFSNKPYVILDRQLRWYDKEMNRAAARSMTKEEILSYPDLRGLFTHLIETAKKFV